jgi:hypothetical protein
MTRVLKTRTLTNLYNQRPAWLAHAHATLDTAVAGAYGWGAEWAAGMGTTRFWRGCSGSIRRGRAGMRGADGTLRGCAGGVGCPYIRAYEW